MCYCKTLYFLENRDGDEEERKKSRKLKKKLENGGYFFAMFRLKLTFKFNLYFTMMNRVLSRPPLNLVQI